MLYGVVFLLLAAQLLALAWVVGGWGWVLAWPAASFAVVAAGYLGLGPRVFGKRPDGTRHPLATVLLFPYLAFTRSVWWVACRFDRQPPLHELVPNVFLGRRAAFHGLPANTAAVIDLTCEFTDVAGIRRLPGYVCLPTLDAGIPDPARFRECVRLAAEFPGVVFIHCAQGHGRSGLFAAAVLLARGLATDPKDAVRQVRAVRRGVRVKPHQMRFLEAFARDP
ncbi:MAG: protein-tyrosine phosphatase family protein [Gemmataceae bacterium]